MLPDERTTLSNTLGLPGDVEALVAAPGRGVARPLVTFLRSQGISVQTAGDADSAFEEALLHPPDVILIDDRILPAGGIELCQRLKGNIRTHFVPTIIFALNDLRQFRLRATAAGADAVFSPSTDAQERRTRLWALLRTRALFTRFEKKQRSQGSEIVERRRWVSHLLHDLQGSVAALQANVNFMARFGPPKDDRLRNDFDGSVDDARTVFDQLMQSVRTVIDFDRVEQHNLGTQSYEEGDIGAFKVDALRARCYRATGVEIAVVSQPLTERNAAKLLRDADLVLDTFDRSASRRLVTDACATLGRPCLHLGMNTDYGEVHWNEGYRVPSAANDDVCDYPLARNLVLLTVAVSAEVVVRFAATGERAAYTITLEDFAVRAHEGRARQE